MSRSPSPFSACWKKFSRVNAISTSLSCLSGFNPLLPSGDIIAVALESPTTAREGKWRRGGGLKGVLFEGKGRSQSPVHRLSGIGGGAMGSPAGTESVVMSSLARSHVSLSLTHTRRLTSASSATKTEEFIPVGQLSSWFTDVTLSNLSLSPKFPPTICKHTSSRRSRGSKVKHQHTAGHLAVAPPPAATLTCISRNNKHVNSADRK